jgi:cell division protein FtsB
MEDLYVILIGLLLILALFTVASLASKLDNKEEAIKQLQTEVCNKEAEIEELKKENRMLRTDLQLAREGFPDKL